ncbi:hypothetical protein K439DRAFT_1631537 [Ramaria rubella]|nr:hypothetical protein K439DRAFT_1631537 [Ramaria rubella]
MSESNTANTVPPFIPGILVVGILIAISILVGWRNYLRRGNPRLVPDVGDWTFYMSGMEGGPLKQEEPKLWEVGVAGKGASEMSYGDTGWENIMPLSATSLSEEQEDPHLASPLFPELSHNSGPPDVTSLLPRLRFLSPAASDPQITVSPSQIPQHRLQVSVLISMPSLSSQTRSRTRLRPSPSSDPELASEILPRASTSSQSSLRKDVDYDEEEEGCAPEVAFGVAILPWQKDEEKKEPQTHNHISVS